MGLSGILKSNCISGRESGARLFFALAFDCLWKMLSDREIPNSIADGESWGVQSCPWGFPLFSLPQPLQVAARRKWEGEEKMINYQRTGFDILFMHRIVSKNRENGVDNQFELKKKESFGPFFFFFTSFSPLSSHLLSPSYIYLTPPPLLSLSPRIYVIVRVHPPLTPTSLRRSRKTDWFGFGMTS